MYAGVELAKALAEAIEKKGVKQVDVAKAFGVKQQAVSAWIKTGRISKEHIGKLIEYFSDVVPPSHFGIENMALINAPSTHNQGTINNVTGDQNTNNFFGEETTEKEAQAMLGDKNAKFLSAIPVLGIDDGVRYALNPKEISEQIKNQAEREVSFMKHSEKTFSVKVAENITGVWENPINQNDVLVIEPSVVPKNQDLVLVCLNYKKTTQRGVIAKLYVDLDNNYTIKYSDSPAVALPENALICGVVVKIERNLLPNDLVISRINDDWDILNTLNNGIA